MAVSTMAGMPALKDLYSDLKRRMDHAVEVSVQPRLSAHRPRQRAHA